MLNRKLIFHALLSLPAVSTAGTFTREALTLDEGNASAQLAATGQRYVDAMQRLIDTRWHDAYSARRWETLESSMSGIPVARLEYRGPDGTVARVYHAMGDTPLSDLAADIFAGESRPSTPDSFDEFELEEADPEVRTATLARYVTQDAEDARMFTPDDALNVRAKVQPADTSRFRPYVIDGRDRALDAEFKAIAALESDLSSGSLPRGGRATILLSGETCNSCEYAFKAAALRGDIDVHLVRMMPSVSPAEGKLLIAEGKARWKGTRLVDPVTGRPLLAADALDSLREAQVRQSISPAAMKRRFSNIPWEPRTFRMAPPEELGETPPADTGRPPPGC